MIFTETILNGSYVIELNAFTDERGWFARTYCKKEFSAIGHHEGMGANESFFYK